MQDLSTTPSRTFTHALSRRDALRWFATFLGFPIAGEVATIIVGRVDSLGPALVGGLITGAGFGAVQAWGLGRNRPPVVAWIAATALGFAAGLAAGAAVVDYDTTLRALAIQGIFMGVAVGAAQAVVLVPRLGPIALAWPLALGPIWAAGWAVTTAAGIHVEDQFTVFGSTGAITVTILTAVLPMALNRNERTHR